MRSGRLGQGLALVVAASVGAAVTYLVIARAPEPTPTPVPIDPAETVCERTFAATGEINGYLAERAGLDPAVLRHPLSGLPESEHQAAWEAYLVETGEHMQETVNRFMTDFGGEVQFLVNRFDRAGAWGEDMPTEVVVVNELGIRNLITQLEAAARQAGCEP